MDTLIAQQVTEAPEHPVLPQAGKYDVRELRLNWVMGTDNAVLEIEASTHENYVILHFEGVEDLHVPCGDVMTSIKLQIQDTSQCPSPRFPAVRVGGTSECWGLCFWASSVMRLDNHEAKPL